MNLNDELGLFILITFVVLASILLCAIVLSNLLSRNTKCENCGQKARVVGSMRRQYSVCVHCHHTIALDDGKEDRYGG